MKPGDVADGRARLDAAVGQNANKILACIEPGGHTDAVINWATWATLRLEGPYGTFIHFDLESRSIAADEIGFLRETVPLFMNQLP